MTEGVFKWPVVQDVKCSKSLRFLTWGLHRFWATYNEYLVTRKKKCSVLRCGSPNVVIVSLVAIYHFVLNLTSVIIYLCSYQLAGIQSVNPLAPNDVYISRTAQLTCRRCILNIYSTNILTEYFKHAAHSPFFLSLSLQDAVYFIMLSFLVPVIFTF